ncbi:hypothetical protein AAU01_38800 [Paenarthrobacter aurescens]|uniref:Uncharacterized protein n=1 Tax=Paenarthrobacter aurescens TaxID=43663 RepID=A0A4Y3NKY9_PAEAU|nr:hypothetical protein AAU01_38800 [Paenarthrobacter aurescens]
MHYRVPSHQSVRISRRAGANHAVDRIHHHKSTPHHGQHLRGTFREQGFIHIQIHDAALPLADSEREHAKDAQRQAYQASDDTYEQWIHVSSLCCGKTAKQ